MTNDLEHNALLGELYDRVKTLNERLWENRATRADVEAWLENFASDAHAEPSERVHALYLLSRFMYFGDREVRVLLRAMYRDIFRYRIVASLRRSQGDTLDTSALEVEFKDELAGTRFLGLGNPAESGTHLLYFFRQENNLAKTQFVHTHQVFDRRIDASDVRLADTSVRRLVYVDDFCGSGHQAVDYSNKVIPVIRDAAVRTAMPVELCYYVLFATSAGLQEIQEHAAFDHVAAVYELDATYRTFDPDSRYFRTQPSAVDRGFAETTCRTYGARLWPGFPLGYDDSQLMIGFHHNTPDNTLPIFWYDDDDGPPWRAIFRRYVKIYG